MVGPIRYWKIGAFLLKPLKLHPGALANVLPSLVPSLLPPAVLPIPIQSSFLFPRSSNEVMTQGRDKLRQLAEILKSSVPGKKILVEGHASRERAGQEAHNQLISEKRARSVAAELALYGVPEKNLTFRGLGATQPVQSNTTEEGRRHNRRVEVKVMLGET